MWIKTVHNNHCAQTHKTHAEKTKQDGTQSQTADKNHTFTTKASSEKFPSKIKKEKLKQNKI